MEKMTKVSSKPSADFRQAVDQWNAQATHSDKDKRAAPDQETIELIFGQ
jgi:hypothetical protein